LSRSGLSPSESAIDGNAVAMIVESRFCMNNAHDTISIVSNCRTPGCISASSWMLAA
jgi:hypothetical protein